MGRKMLIGSDPIAELWGFDLTKPQYILAMDFIESIIIDFDVTDIVLCHPYDHLKPLVQLMQTSMEKDLGFKLSITLSSETNDTSNSSDPFSDIDLIFLLIHDDLSDGSTHIRSLHDRYPNSPHLRTEVNVFYKYSWQVDLSLSTQSDICHRAYEKCIKQKSEKNNVSSITPFLVKSDHSQQNGDK